MQPQFPAPRSIGCAKRDSLAVANDNAKKPRRSEQWPYFSSKPDDHPLFFWATGDHLHDHEMDGACEHPIFSPSHTLHIYLKSLGNSTCCRRSRGHVPSCWMPLVSSRLEKVGTCPGLMSAARLRYLTFRCYLLYTTPSSSPRIRTTMNVLSGCLCFP